MVRLLCVLYCVVDVILLIVSYWVCWCFPIKHLLKVFSLSCFYYTFTIDEVSILV